MTVIFSMADSSFLSEQLTVIESMIAAVISAVNIPAAINDIQSVSQSPAYQLSASLSMMNILFFYLDMLFSLCQDDKIYQSVTAFIIHLQEIIMKKNAR